MEEEFSVRKRKVGELYGDKLVDKSFQVIQPLDTVITRKMWNRKTNLKQKLSVFDVTTQTVSLGTYYITYLVKWVCLHCTIAVSDVH